MKGQWNTKHNKVKDFTKSNMKSDQGYASAIISKYVKAWKARRAAKKELERKEANFTGLEEGL